MPQKPSSQNLQEHPPTDAFSWGAFASRHRVNPRLVNESASMSPSRASAESPRAATALWTRAGVGQRPDGAGGLPLGLAADSQITNLLHAGIPLDVVSKDIAGPRLGGRDHAALLRVTQIQRLAAASVGRAGRNRRKPARPPTRPAHSPLRNSTVVHSVRAPAPGGHTCSNNGA